MSASPIGDALYEYRNKQVQKRVEEVRHTLDTLEHFNAGNVCSNLSLNPHIFS